MSPDQKRTMRQQGLLKAWIAAKCRGSTVCSTGFGKTRLALMAIQEMNRLKPHRTTIVGVPGKDLKEQWEKQVAEWGLLNVQVIVVNTLIKMMDRGTVSCDLFIADELHTFAALGAIRCFKEITYKFILGLTATLERSDERHLLIAEYAPVFDEVTTEECLREGWIAPFRTFNLGLELSDADREKYLYYNGQFNKSFTIFNYDLQFAIACAGSKEKRESFAQEIGWDIKDVDTAAFNFGRFMRLRKTFLYEHPAKIVALQRLLDAFPVPTITFSLTTAVPAMLAKMMPDISVDYGSHLSAKKKDSNLKRFLEEDAIRVIHTAKAFNAGKDIPALELAIVLAGTSVYIENNQRRGRILRRMADKQAYIVNIYMKNTQDEKWLRSRQAKEGKVTWVNSVESILLQTGKALPKETEYELSLE